ncbi:DUF551 domain-containing protein [Escherichia coli]|uniref:DUF551 domain-containing protein n=1 Tax=Escherichia coli TaxID=562 RepID=UPI001293D849|nr:DUF551 domain-containing protein [Escherichia coli]EFA5069355.1 DUF551 domain-containing protein [Escherichia coli]EFA9480527.1 DUF551 domain-containing protein [Escherichia coli]EFB9816615.1 DUF551 domain-containing protein [Escherichia coli]EFC4585050.1 DUF551 domain-containing protein [Escherichia coli]EFU9443360.1 DUF551 domain-containing protein [Escherichia coli]
MTTFTDKELIKEIKERIGSLDVRDNIERRAYEIALASLEAEPVVYMWDSERKDIDAPGYYRTEHLVFAESSVKQWGGRVVPLYTAPPATVTPDGWISCSERMPVIGELNWRTSFPLLITCEIGVIPAYYGFVSINGDRHYGFMESLKYGDDSGGHPQTNEYDLISNVTHWMPLPEPPQEMK